MYNLTNWEKTISIHILSNVSRSKPGKQAIAIHILPNILRSKSKVSTKLDQLIEYNMSNIFLEKSYTKCQYFRINKFFEFMTNKVT